MTIQSDRDMVEAFSIVRDLADLDELNGGEHAYECLACDAYLGGRDRKRNDLSTHETRCPWRRAREMMRP